jgi:hypothetical protein
MNSLAIFVDSQEQLSFVEQIRNCPQIKQQNYNDIFVVSDKDIWVKDFAKISSFYMGFTKTDLVFMNLEDFLLNKDIAPSNTVYVATTAQEVLSQQLELNDLKHIRIIELCNTTN